MFIYSRLYQCLIVSFKEDVGREHNLESQKTIRNMSNKSKDFILIGSLVGLLHRYRIKVGESTLNLQFSFLFYSGLLFADKQANAKLPKL